MYGAVPKCPACVLKRICGGTGVMMSSFLPRTFCTSFGLLAQTLFFGGGGAIHHSQNHILVLVNLLLFTVVLCGQSNPEGTFIQDGQEERFPYKR
jgi:hypothetical protein